MPEPSLAVEKATVCYGPPQARVRALDGLSLSFETGALTLVMGPSGSGKTTLLSLLGCLLKPDEGGVRVNGEDVVNMGEGRRTQMRRTSLGYVFQAFRLLHSLSALDNVLIAAEIAGARDAGRVSSAKKLLTELGLGSKMALKPGALSGGEKQRVALARALLSNPGVVLADEPTASLDSQAGRQICEILRGLADNQKRTIVVVSHDPRWESFAHRTVVLQDGRLVEDRSSVQ